MAKSTALVFIAAQACAVLTAPAPAAHSPSYRGLPACPSPTTPLPGAIASTVLAAPATPTPLATVAPVHQHGPNQ